MVVANTYSRHKTRTLLGQESFLGIWALINLQHKHSPTTWEKKAQQAKDLQFLLPGNFHFKLEILPINDHNQGIFFPKLALFFPIFEKGHGRLPPSPSPLLVTCLYSWFVLYWKKPWLKNFQLHQSG